MTFRERLKRYKAEEDFFVVDVYRGGVDPYDTVHDLTYKQAKALQARELKKDEVSRCDVLVEDWDSEDDYLFKMVSNISKEPYRFNVDLKTFKMTATAWRKKGEKAK